MEQHLATIDHSTLLPLVQCALGRDDLEIVTWQAQPVTGGVEMAADLYRLSGEARTALDLLPWSLILLFARRRDGHDQIVAIDWSYGGIASIGEEMAPLVNASIGFGAVTLSEAFRLEQIVLEGYVAGLRDAGWRGDPDQVKFSYAATLYWRYAIGGFAGEMVPYMLDERAHAAVEAAWGRSMEELADATAASLDFVQHVYEEALRFSKV